MADATPCGDATHALLGRCPIFRRCGPDDLTALAASARWVELADGADLVREGDAPHDLLIIDSGHCSCAVSHDR